MSSGSGLSALLWVEENHNEHLTVMQSRLLVKIYHLRKTVWWLKYLYFVKDIIESNLLFIYKSYNHDLGYSMKMTSEYNEIMN